MAELYASPFKVTHLQILPHFAKTTFDPTPRGRVGRGLRMSFLPAAPHTLELLSLVSGSSPGLMLSAQPSLPASSIQYLASFFSAASLLSLLLVHPCILVAKIF